jgi:hypothetical protein
LDTTVDSFVSVAVGGICVGLAVIFIWSAFAKSISVVRGNAADLIDLVPLKPTMQVGGLWALVAVELAVALLLIATPSTGLLLASLLLLVLTVRVATLRREYCQCFGGAFEFGTSKAALMARNLTLFALSLFVPSWA